MTRAQSFVHFRICDSHVQSITAVCTSTIQHKHNVCASVCVIGPFLCLIELWNSGMCLKCGPLSVDALVCRPPFNLRGLASIGATNLMKMTSNTSAAEDARFIIFVIQNARSCDAYHFFLFNLHNLAFMLFHVAFYS